MLVKIYIRDPIRNKYDECLICFHKDLNDFVPFPNGMKMFYGLFQCYLWFLEYLLWYLEDISYNQGILIG
jgi:hypothetical protein